MRVVKGVVSQYQASAGTTNTQFYTGRALAIRIVPNLAIAGSNGVPGIVRLPRNIIVDGGIINQIVELCDSGWYVLDWERLKNANFGNIQNINENVDNPLSHVTGRQVTLRFNVEQTGTSATDVWDVYIAEDPIDLMCSIASLVQLSNVSGTTLYQPLSSAGFGSGLSVIISGSVTSAFSDTQLFDATATASSPLSSGTIGTGPLRDYLIRITGFTAPTSRALTILGVRSDLSTFSLFTPAAIGATVVDAEVALGQGSNIPAAPVGATSVGFSFSGPMPISWQANLSSGTDTPRMTIWGRQSS